MVRYQDEDYCFAEGSWGRIGRDDDACQIPIWEELRRQRLSRVAGELWCVEGELWVRNLSESHELAVLGGAGRPQLLPPRIPPHRGAACSVPTPTATLTAPTTGTWRVTAHQAAAGRAAADGCPGTAAQPGPGDLPGTAHFPTGTAIVTSRVGPVPEELLGVAAALCAPIIEQDATAATYDDVAVRLSITKRQARRYVEKLCDHYRDQVAHIAQDDSGRPLYAPVAELLVRRGRVTSADVAALDAPR